MNDNYLTDYIRLISPYISPSLISKQHWTNLEKVTNTLPSALTNFFGFECRLGVPEAKADFLICSDATEAGRRVLAANAYDIDLPQELLQNPVWMNVRHFCTNWESEASPLYQKVRNIWLEFDVVDDMPKIPVPSFFFGPEFLYNLPIENDQHPHSWIWEVALPLLWGRDVPTSLNQNLARCFEVLPENAYVFQIGLMLAREWDGVRLCIRDISPNAIVDYLTSIGWQGNTKVLQRILNNLSFMERIDLDIDIGEHVALKIGLECYLHKQPQFEESWSLLFNNLIEMGLCLPEKKQALLEYPGYIRERMNPELWPKSVKKLSWLLGSQVEWVVFKGLHHIKLTYDEAALKEAKAYLYVSRSMVKG